MNYLEAVNRVNHLEKQFDLLSIKIKGVSVWPLLRINLIDRLCSRDKSMRSGTGSAVRLVFKTLFLYNPCKIFKLHKIWLFAGYERRKKVGDKNILRVSGGVGLAEPNTLVIEKPYMLQLKGKDSNIPERNIVSESWQLLFTHFYALFFKFFGIRIDNEGVLHTVLRELNVKFDYKSELSILLAQYRVTDFLLKICPKPDKVIIECPYTVMGYVWAFHHNGIQVIEMQHGVLNKQHYAYNSRYHSDVLYPDEIWCFGEDEYKYLTSEECHYCKVVEKTGLFFLELADSLFREDPFKEARLNYKYIVLVSGQRSYEKELATFTNIIAEKEKEILFVYVPRTEEEKVEFSQGNVLYKPNVNIYQYMKWCDMHLTISSTTVLECQYFEKPTVFYDYENMGSTYYGNILTEENAVKYINSPSEFGDVFKALMNGSFKFKECFTKGNVELIKKLLNK